MKIRRNLSAAVCEADCCQERAEYRLELGEEPWLTVHLCGKCLRKLGQGIVTYVGDGQAGAGRRRGSGAAPKAGSSGKSCAEKSSGERK